jgi:tRNA-modifying protein YgfZ
MTATVERTAPADYLAALEGAALVDETSAGRIFMRGKDRAALLHRLSTNDIERLKPGEGARTVLTTPIGRIIDLLTVHALEDALLLVTSPEQGPPVYGHLKRNIFFNDQVTLEPAGRSHGQIALYGPRAQAILESLARGAAFGSLERWHTARVTVAGGEMLVARSAPIGGGGFTLYPPVEALEAIRAALVAAGVTPLSAASFEVLRVEQGYATYGRELGQEYIPLETGLLDAVSFSKGCYVGQEIIARMESRGRLAKRLMGLRLRPSGDEGAAATEALLSLALPAKLEVGGKEAGDLTSVAHSPRLGPIALAYVRSAHAEPGAVVGVGGTALQAEVAELPLV